MSGGGVDIAARQAWFEEQAAHAESEWIDSLQERFEDGDDVPDKEHFIALWLAERDPLATDLAAAIARAEAWKQAFTIERQRLYISQGMKIEQARIHAENDAAIAAQQAEGEDRG